MENSKLMTADEFLAWDDGTDTRYELADGVARAMPQPSGPHRTVVANAGGIIFNALGDRRPCRGENDACLVISQHVIWRADIVVTCQPAAREIVDPLLIVQLLSRSTVDHDLGRKLNDFKAFPSVREIWMIDSERHWFQLWRRDGDRWTGRDLVGAAAFDSGTLGCVVELDEVYADSGL